MDDTILTALAAGFTAITARLAILLEDNVTPAIEKIRAAMESLRLDLARQASAAGEARKLLRIAQHRRTKKQVARLLREEARTAKRALGSHSRFGLENT